MFKLSLYLLFWSLIFGFIIGIFGISLSLIQITNFYIQEGTQQVDDTYTYRIVPSENMVLNDDTIVTLQNVEGVAFADPYITPTNTITGSINYFGFTASYPIQVQGVPKRLGIQKAKNQYKNSWDSADITSIPVLLPQQAITLYNNLAPQRGWPSLSEDSFLGLPGTSLAIDNNSYQVVISGFDADEFGTIVTVPSQKLFSILETQGLNPNYDYILIETVPGLTRLQARNTANTMTSLGYSLASAKEESFQQGLFIRIKYTVTIFGVSILIAFIVLLFYSIHHLFLPIKNRIFFYRVWGIKDTLPLISIIIFSFFSFLTGIISWIICFFAVIPVQEYITSTISHFGFNVPSLRESAKIALESGFMGLSLFFLVNIFTLLYFYKKIPKADYIKKF